MKDWNDRKQAGEAVDPDDLVERVASAPAVDDVGPMLDELDPDNRYIPGNEAASKARNGRLRPLPELMTDAWARLDARARGDERCLPVPWASLAKLFDPYAGASVLRPGVHVLVGGTGSGKTQLALALALEAAHEGHPVAYVGLELDTPGIGARLAALEWARIRRPREVKNSERWSVIDWPRTEWGHDALRRVRDEVADELGKLDGFRVTFAGARDGFSADDFRELCKGVAKDSTRARPGLVVLDFLQLLGPGANPDDREIRTRIARAAYVANDAARDGRLAVLLVSATARENYRKLVFKAGGDTVPFAGSLVGLGKESGEIEYSATSVLVIARRSGENDVRYVGLAKNRHGGEGWAVLGWNGSDFHEPPRVVQVTEALDAGEDDGSESPKPAGTTKAKNDEDEGFPG